MTDWHVWTVAANRQKRIFKFLSELEDIEDFLYPMVEKEYETKSGKRIKDVPIYANYIFIKYYADFGTNAKIERCPWISTYIGKCSIEEISNIQAQSKYGCNKLISMKNFKNGDKVKLIGTPFIGWNATVVEVRGNKLSVSITIFGDDRVIKCDINDVSAV